jgi:myo-inositol-hexaphosphate 3-phosphohydrolase
MLSFLKECKILPVENSVAAGKATTVGEVIDTAGFQAACFIYKLGAVTDAAVVTLKIYQDSDPAMGTVKELSGASAAIAAASSDSDQMLVVDVINPSKRYLRPTIVTADQNVEIDSAFCILYNPAVIPVTQPDTVDVGTLVVSPAEV